MKIQINSNYTPSKRFLQLQNEDFSNFFLYFSRTSAFFTVTRKFSAWFFLFERHIDLEKSNKEEAPAPFSGRSGVFEYKKILAQKKGLLQNLIGK